MHTRISLALAALMGAPACGAPDEATEPQADRDIQEGAESPAASFYVELDQTTAPEDAIPQILEAGRSELAAACAGRPEMLVCVFNPLDPGAYADVSCASMLSGDASAREQRPGPGNGDEPIGVTQQRWSPIGLGSGLFMFGATMIATSALCPRARGPGRAQRCSDYSGAALGSIGVLCAFL
ncbi:hypothetical protein [Sorangium sp. So ce1099]|uniref:hypothetical protein n=1 Tax=Sorangium sp. So ce1099 TaxID=3133331 RepID=UPI003F60039F